jgi:hypothetical protein
MGLGTRGPSIGDFLPLAFVVSIVSGQLNEDSFNSATLQRVSQDNMGAKRGMCSL